MPSFTEPVTLEDMRAYKQILRDRIVANGNPNPPKLEVFRHLADGPIVVGVGEFGTDVVRELRALPVT